MKRYLSLLFCFCLLSLQTVAEPTAVERLSTETGIHFVIPEDYEQKVDSDGELQLTDKKNGDFVAINSGDTPEPHSKARLT